MTVAGADVFAKRTYQRKYAAKQRAKKLAEANRGLEECQKRHGSGICGGKLELRRVEGGYARICQLCIRQAMGICRDCDERVDGRRGTALRCATHKEVAKREQDRASQQRHHAKYLVKHREAYQSDAELRARRNEYKRAYRRLHPEKTREQKRRATARNNAAKKRSLRWHKRYRSKKAVVLRKRQMAMLQYYREHPDRPQPKCAGCHLFLDWSPSPGGARGAPPKWCDACCPKHEKIRRMKLGRSYRAVAEPPLIAYVPPLSELEMRFAPGTRTCLTPGCDIVVTHRKKKCSKCKAREAAAAAEILKRHIGRGRRTDLEGRVA